MTVKDRAKQCCVCDKGYTLIKAKVDKNVYYSNEVAKASISVDNSASQLAVRRVQYNVYQVLQIHDGFSPLPAYEFRFNGPSSKTEERIEAGDKKEGISLQINLSEIKKEVSKTKMVKVNLIGSKEEVERSAEEVFMKERLAAATKSKHIKNEYFLKISVAYDACTCGGATPTILVPLCIIPLTMK